MLGIPQLTEAIKKLTNVVVGSGSSMRLRMDQLIEQNGKIISLLEKITTEPPSQPKPFSFRSLRHIQVGEKTMLQFAVSNLPAVDMTDTNNKDFDKQVLTVMVNGVSPQTFTSNSADAIDEVAADDAGNAFVGNHDDAIEGTLTYFDKAGNASTPRVVTATLTDTISPSQPGEFGFTVKGQV